MKKRGVGKKISDEKQRHVYNTLPMHPRNYTAIMQYYCMLEEPRVGYRIHYYNQIIKAGLVLG